MKRSLILPLILVFASGFAQIPEITGKMVISVTKGTIECNLIVTGYPKMDNYVILLNTGFNVRNIKRNGDDMLFYYERGYDKSESYESFGYFMPDNTDTGKYLPEKGFKISYVGAFPVVSDTVDPIRSDWAGNIAFNGKTVRASAQSAWYPVLYDIDKDIKYNEVKYNIDITCNDCKTIYINGSQPIEGITASLHSDIPHNLVLFAGDYKMNKTSENFFLNPDINDAQINQFNFMVDKFKQYYEKKISVPYEEKITFIQTTPLSKAQSWLFVNYPTIVNIGSGDHGFREFLLKAPESYQFIAHELAHYYFGEILKSNSELGDMISETFAEYLAMKSSLALLGDSVYKEMMSTKIKDIQNFRAVPFSKVKSQNDYDNRDMYVYTYGPLILSAIEKETDEYTVFKWIHNILLEKTEFTNYSFLYKTLKEAVNDDVTMAIIEERYLSSNSSVSNALMTLKRK